MRILLVHPNFPSQLRSIAAVLGSNPNHEVCFLTTAVAGEMPGVRKIIYKRKRDPSPQTHHYIRPFEDTILHGQGAYEVMLARQYVEQWQEHLLDFRSTPDPDNAIKNIFWNKSC